CSLRAREPGHTCFGRRAHRPAKSTRPRQVLTVNSYVCRSVFVVLPFLLDIFCGLLKISLCALVNGLFSVPAPLFGLLAGSSAGFLLRRSLLWLLQQSTVTSDLPARQQRHPAG